jgi:hypothetical protein
VQQGRAHRVIGRVELGQCGAEQRKRGLVLAGGPGGVGRPGQQLDPVQTGHSAGVRHLVPQLQGAFVVALGLRESVGRGGGLAGPDPCRQRPGGLAGRVPVDGQLGGCYRGGDAGQLGPLGERLRQAGVEPCPLAGQQVGVDHLAEQGVTDVVAVLAGCRHQELAGDRGPQRLGRRLVAQAGHERQQPMGDPPAHHRDDRQDPGGGLGQPVDPAAEQVPERCRQFMRAGPHDRQELLGEEGVAF